MTDVADLQIRVSSLEATVAKRRLDDMAVAGGRAERATDGLMASMARFVSVAAAGAAVMAGFAKVVAVQREFDVINAGLITATGSAEDAAVAFEALKGFAETTPFSLQEVSNAFVKLVNYGLTPSERALTSYGNTAAATGKNVLDLVEAVADATTGEFERVKEAFLVKAKQDGDRVRLTFRGVTEEIGNNAREIEEYFIRLGENNFADNMALRIATLDGAMSNLGDQWDSLFLNLSGSGLGDAVGDGVRAAIDVLSELNAYLESGQFEGHLDAMGAAWGPWADDAGEAVDAVQGFLGDLWDFISQNNPQLLADLTQPFREFPQNVRAAVQIAATHFAWFVERARITATAIGGYMEAIGDGWGGKQIADIYAQAEAASARNNANLEDSIGLIFKERDATRDLVAARLADADASRAQHDAKKPKGPVLGQYGIDRPDPDGTDPRAAKAAESEAKRRQTQFRSLVEDLRTEEEALAASYQERVALVEQFTTAESALRAELMDRLDAWRAQEADGIAEAKGRELEQIRRSLLTEEQALQESYERRRQVVLESVAVSEDARQRMLEQLDRQHSEDLAREQAERQAKRDRLFQDFMTESEMLRSFRDQRIEEQRQAYAEELIDWEEFQRNKAAIEQQYHEASAALTRQGMIQSLDIYGGMIGGLGQMFAQFAQSQGRNSEKMFRISKALNIAQAVMATAAGIMEAQRTEQSQYQRIAEQVRIAALGAVQVAAISSQQYSGAYDKGGYIPAGKFGIVGERGMELVSGPANVTSREETSRLLRQAAEGGGGSEVNVSISVVVDNGGNAQARTDVSGGDAEQARNAKEFARIVDGRVRDVIVREQRQGGLLSSVR